MIKDTEADKRLNKVAAEQVRKNRGFSVVFSEFLIKKLRDVGMAERSLNFQEVPEVASTFDDWIAVLRLANDSYIKNYYPEKTKVVALISAEKIIEMAGKSFSNYRTIYEHRLDIKKVLDGERALEIISEVINNMAQLAQERHDAIHAK